MIGIFDSGAGGLSVFREIRKLLPDERYIYYSDNANCPYGEKSRDFITERTRAITRFLIEQGAEVIVVACNTATAASIATLRAEFPVEFIGMEPAVKPAAARTRTGVVGVLATAGTLKATKYIDTREKWARNVTISENIGKGFVELVEKGIVSGPEAEAVVSRSLIPILDQGADTIVLGCTHYPFLSETILKTAAFHTDREITLIDPAPAVARHLLEIMEEKGLVRKDGFSMKLHSSGDISTLEHIYNKLI